jgi:hypothetical protein
MVEGQDVQRLIEAQCGHLPLLIFR